MLKKVESLIFTDDKYDEAVAFFRDTLVLEIPSESSDMVKFELNGFPIFVARAKEGAASFVTLESDDIESDYAVLQKRGMTVSGAAQHHEGRRQGGVLYGAGRDALHAVSAGAGESIRLS